MKHLVSLLFFCIALLFSGMLTAGNFNSSATGIGVAGAKAKAQAGAISGSRSSVRVRANQRQGQHQGQSQGQHQGQLQGNIGLGSGNETTIINNEDYSEMYDDYTPPAYAPSMGVSAPCKVGISGGAGVPGLSISGGGYVTDEDCIEAETIRMGLQSGNPENMAAANTLLRMRLDAALATRKTENEEELVSHILNSPTPTLAEAREVRNAEITNGVWTH